MHGVRMEQERGDFAGEKIWLLVLSLKETSFFFEEFCTFPSPAIRQSCLEPSHRRNAGGTFSKYEDGLTVDCKQIRQGRRCGDVSLTAARSEMSDVQPAPLPLPVSYLLAFLNG